MKTIEELTTIINSELTSMDDCKYDAQFKQRLKDIMRDKILPELEPLSLGMDYRIEQRVNTKNRILDIDVIPLTERCYEMFKAMREPESLQMIEVIIKIGDA